MQLAHATHLDIALVEVTMSKLAYGNSHEYVLMSSLSRNIHFNLQLSVGHTHRF